MDTRDPYGTAHTASITSVQCTVFQRKLTVPLHFEEELSFSTLHLDIFPVGEDLSVLLYGGDKPHIGCTVLAVPRLSLSGDGSVSCTSSVINLTGHKDEQICRYAAEALCKRYQTAVSCAGGFHVDGITSGQIRELMEKLDVILGKCTV